MGEYDGNTRDARRSAEPSRGSYRAMAVAGLCRLCLAGLEHSLHREGRNLRFCFPAWHHGLRHHRGRPARVLGWFGGEVTPTSPFLTGWASVCNGVHLRTYSRGSIRARNPEEAPTARSL